VVANKNVSIDIEAGGVVGLIGPNGAGKTTFVDAISGFAPATGRIQLAGVDMLRLPPHERRAAGLSRTWQAGELFANLTVRENVAVALAPGGLRALVRDVLGRRSTTMVRQVDDVLEQLGLAEHAEDVARELPLGKQKLVGVARALAGTCSTVLLDEPAAGLDTDESREMGARIRSIASRGIGVLLIDHDMALVLDICDTVNVLHLGSLIYSGPPAGAVEDAGVVEAYLGTPLE
jgi:branched-chain amino acid transport system ATP-binding protein